MQVIVNVEWAKLLQVIYENSKLRDVVECRFDLVCQSRMVEIEIEDEMSIKQLAVSGAGESIIY